MTWEWASVMFMALASAILLWSALLRLPKEFPGVAIEGYAYTPNLDKLGRALQIQGWLNFAAILLSFFSLLCQAIRIATRA